MTTMKRMREDGGIQSIDIANCLMLLSHGIETKPRKRPLVDVFECKTCNRQFTSFQALGGHRASHKRPRLMGEDLQKDRTKFQTLGSTKPKMHECSICGLEFATGQALGGHMRRHRANMSEGGFSSINNIPVVSKVAPLLKRSNSTRFFGLDLNLTPLENDLKILFGKMAPKVDQSFFV